MTLNELIRELQTYADNGMGDAKVRNAEGDDIYSILDDDRINEIIIYF